MIKLKPNFSKITFFNHPLTKVDDIAYVFSEDTHHHPTPWRELSLAPVFFLRDFVENSFFFKRNAFSGNLGIAQF